MFYLVTGGSGSGKSAFAENLVTKLNSKEQGALYYIATMHPYDEESVVRIERHRKMRKGKGFTTIEQELFLHETPFLPEKTGTYLLEDLSNLLSNEMFIGAHKEWFLEEQEKGASGGTIALFNQIKMLSMNSANFVLVTNEIFSDHEAYSSETRHFMRELGYLNCRLAKAADGLIEVVCGIPIWQKGREEC